MTCANTPQSQLTKTKKRFWAWQETAAKNPTNILQALASENKRFADLLKSIPRSGSQLSRARPHHRPLAPTRSNRLAHPQSPAPLNQHHKLWPTANSRKPRLVSKNHGSATPRRPFSPPTKHLALTQHLGQTAQLPHHSRLSRKNDRSRLTAPQPQASPRPIFKVPCPSNCHAAQLTCDGSASAFAVPKLLALATSAFSFRLQRASFLCPCPTIASAARRRRPTTTAGDATSPDQPPRLAHGVAVSAARTVRPKPLLD